MDTPTIIAFPATLQYLLEYFVLHPMMRQMSVPKYRSSCPADRFSSDLALHVNHQLFSRTKLIQVTRPHINRTCLHRYRYFFFTEIFFQMLLHIEPSTA